MKLNYLQLCNFRQFYGKTPQIEFASGDRTLDSSAEPSAQSVARRDLGAHALHGDNPHNGLSRNTTVIYGNNGAGKTSILNAFTWVLYEKFTAAFASPELLVNQRSLAEAAPEQAVECWVELQFERDRKIYQLKRKCYATRNAEHRVSYSQANLFMLVAGDDGRWYPPVEAPEDIINRILPASLHQYFFFDGERIDGFFRQNHNSYIAEDTKELLGVKVLDRGIEHLKKAKRSLQEELEELGDAQTKQLLRQQIDLEQDLEDIKQQLDRTTKEVAELEQRKGNLSRQLLEISGADEIQKLKLKLVKQQKTARQNLLERKQELKKLLSRDSYLVFLSGVSDRWLDLLQTLRDRGQLSTGLKQEFIQQLLDTRSCLCGLSLTPDTEAYRNVKAWLEKAELKGVEEAAIRLETQVSTVESEAANFWQQLDRNSAEIKQQYSELNRLETEIERVNRQLNSFPNRDSQQLQQHLEVIESRIKRLILEQGELQQQQSDRAKSREQLTQKIARHQLTESKQQLAQKRISVTQEAISRLDRVRTRLEQQFRLALEQKVREIFSFISFTPYLPQLSEDYKLTLIEKTSGIETPVAASTGENQILSLSFIGAIIDRVREWSQNNSLVGYDSSTFPIVMDSPFGSLDQIYRRQVAKAIPQLANQLVILVTKTQWQGEVEQETKSLTSREYVLTYYSPKKNCRSDILKLNEQSYLLVKPSLNNFEYTEIVPVKSHFDNYL